MKWTVTKRLLCVSLVGCLVINSLVTILYAQIDTKSYQRYIDLAKEALKVKDYQNAFSYFELAHQIDPYQEAPFIYLNQLPKYGKYARSFDDYMQMANESMIRGQYPTARFYYLAAQIVDPERREPLRYLNLIQRLEQERVTYLSPDGQTFLPKKEISPVPLETKEQEQSVDLVFRVPSDNTTPSQLKVVPIETSPTAKETVKEIAAPARSFEPTMSDDNNQTVEVAPKQKRQQNLWQRLKETFIVSEKFGQSKRNSSQKILVDDNAQPIQEVLLLNEATQSMQPNMKLKVPLRNSLRIKGKNIKRIVVLDENVMDIDRPDSDTIILRPKKRINTFVHIWDSQGRWTFNVDIDFPQTLAALQKEQRLKSPVIYAEPFQFEYSNSLGADYRGPDLNDLDRRTRRFQQRFAIVGDTPYGELDASILYYDFEGDVEYFGETLGLTDAEIGPFKDFSIRAFNSLQIFSPLTLPGTNIYGLALKAYAFDKNIHYQAFTGEDRLSPLAVGGSFSGAGLSDNESYIDGLRVTLFPLKKNRYTFNYVQGRGDDRSDELRERVISLQTENEIGDYKFLTELAYDDEEYAFTAEARTESKDRALDFYFRDIPKNFSTIRWTPSGSGEVGGLINYFRDYNSFSHLVNLDIYRDRKLENPDKDNHLNLDFRTQINKRFDNNSQYVGSFHYVDTPQLLSPRQTFFINNRYQRSFRLFDRDVQGTVSADFQRNRFDRSAPSEYDRYGLMGGVQVPLYKGLSWFLNYNYYWVKAIQDNEKTQPNVLSTGLNYTRQLTDRLSANFDVVYRDEQNTEGRLSFLSGEDSISYGFGLNYRPWNDMSIFLNGRLQNIWPEDPSQDSYFDANVSLGMRSTWDTIFRWNPTGLISGYVFKDYNSDGIKGVEEPGVLDVAVSVGGQVVRTNDDGYYSVQVRGEKVRISIDTKTIPDGSIFTTPTASEVKVIHNKTNTFHFGLSTKSGVYGVVYYDKNDNNQLDEGDEPVRKVRIILDRDKKILTDMSGSYFFDDIAPGEHDIMLDVNSIPIRYLPKTKLKETIIVEEGKTYIYHIPLRFNAASQRPSSSKNENTDYKGPIQLDYQLLVDPSLDQEISSDQGSQDEKTISNEPGVSNNRMNPVELLKVSQSTKLNL